MTDDQVIAAAGLAGALTGLADELDGDAVTEFDDDVGDPPADAQPPADLTDEELAALRPVAIDPATPASGEVN